MNTSDKSLYELALGMPANAFNLYCKQVACLVAFWEEWHAAMMRTLLTSGTEKKD